MNEIVYKIIDHEDGRPLEFYINDEKLDFVDPKEVKVGSIVTYDRGEFEKVGVVTSIEQRDWLYYYVGFPDDALSITEVTSWRVHKCENSGSIEG